MEYSEEKIAGNPECTMNIKFGADMMYPPYDLYPKLRVKELRCILVAWLHSTALLVVEGKRSHQFRVMPNLVLVRNCNLATIFSNHFYVVQKVAAIYRIL